MQGWVFQPGVVGLADAVLTPGAAPVPQIQVWELSTGGVGGERGETVAATVPTTTAVPIPRRAPAPGSARCSASGESARAPGPLAARACTAAAISVSISISSSVVSQSPTVRYPAPSRSQVDVAGVDVPVDVGQHSGQECHERAAVIVRGHPAQFVSGELGVGDRQRVGPLHGAAHPPLVHHGEDTRLRQVATWR